MATSLSLRVRQAQVFRFSQTADLLRLSSQELGEHLSVLASENPMLILRHRAHGAADMIESLAVQDEPSLYHHALNALAGLIEQGGLLERLIIAFIEELEPSGWLGTSVEDLAARHSIDTKLVEEALRLVQQRIEPTGLFARNLAECLRLQLEDAGPLDDDMMLVLANLEVLEDGSAAALVAATGLDPEQVDDCLKSLRGLNPKPGSEFVTDPSQMREPDVVVSRGPAGWEISFSNPNLAEFDVRKVPNPGANDDLVQARNSARSVCHALKLRQLAIQRTIEVLVEYQDAFLERGTEALRPLSMSDLAAKTGFHTSTISRILNGFLIETPHGIVTGKSLCPGAVAKDGTHAKPDILGRIQHLIGKEEPSAPLSDQVLTDRLSAQGIRLSRRVIAKYRQELGYPPAARRKS